MTINDAQDSTLESYKQQIDAGNFDNAEKALDFYARLEELKPSEQPPSPEPEPPKADPKPEKTDPDPEPIETSDSHDESIDVLIQELCKEELEESDSEDVEYAGFLKKEYVTTREAKDFVSKFHPNVQVAGRNLRNDLSLLVKRKEIFGFRNPEKRNGEYLICPRSIVLAIHETQDPRLPD